MTGDILRKKIIGVSVLVVFLAMLCTQSVSAQTIRVDTWTDKPQYNPGEKGKLKISVLNQMTDPVEINNITIRYPWFLYDAEKGEWVGNETIKGDTRILKTISSKGSKDDHYYREAEFTVPSDGRAIMSGSISLYIRTNKGSLGPFTASLSVAATSIPMSIVNLDMWMTTLTVAIVICTVILAMVVFYTRRRTRALESSTFTSTTAKSPKTE